MVEEYCIQILRCFVLEPDSDKQKSDIHRDDSFKTRHKTLLLVRPTQGIEEPWPQPHTFETLMQTARVLYNAFPTDTSFEFDIVYGEPNPYPAGGAGSIFDSRTPVTEEWNQVQKVLLDSPGTTFYVIRQFVSPLPLHCNHC